MSVQVTTIPTGVRISAGMTCPRCAHPMLLVSSTAPMVREWKAVMKCAVCRAEQLLLVRLLEVAEPYDGGRGPNPAACGTQSGYNAHRAQGEAACDACKLAKADASRAYRASNPDRINAAQRNAKRQRQLRGTAA